MNTEQLIEKHLFGKKPEKWDDEFDRIQHLSVNDVRALLDEHAKCVLSDVSTRYSYLEIEEILKSQIDYMIQCVQDSEGTIDPSEDINDIEITLKVLKLVYNVC